MNKHKHPEIYQKSKQTKNYFEGWYYKHVSADCLHTICFIPGVSYDSLNPHAFIQVLYKNPHEKLQAYNITFPLSDFHAVDSPFSVRIGENSFSLNSVKVDLSIEGFTLQGSLQFKNITPIQTSIFHPNIMGMFSYVPNMECNHGILSMNHQIEGSICINDSSVDFTNGKGYIEKDWGRSFPQRYIWIQSNHFDNPSISVFCSIAKIPMGKFSFLGFICNVVCDGNEYRFATYNHSRLKIIEISDLTFHLVLLNKHHSITLKGSYSSAEKLLAPLHGSMNTTIKEGLSGKLHISLQTSDGKVIFSGNTEQCGIELEFPKM